ncbi:MAG: Bor family protein [Cyclonatronaceae bacterium]
MLTFRNTFLILLVSAFLLTGCYNAKVTTGAQPSAQTVENKWAHSFINGLVPPNVMNVAQECSSGVAMVETKLSFLNQIAAGLTFGIYTPMSITVTCAAGSAVMPEDVKVVELEMSRTAPDFEQGMKQALSEAARNSRDHQKPVYVSFN